MEDNFIHILKGSSSIKKYLKDFLTSAESLSATMKEALSYVKDTTNQVENFDLQVEEQNTVVQESTSAVNQMSASLDNVAKITSFKRDTTQALLDIAEEDMNAMKKTNTAVEVPTNNAHSLLDINKIVSDIADSIDDSTDHVNSLIRDSSLHTKKMFASVSELTNK